MNIHEAVLKPIAALVYCNRHAAAGPRQQTNVGNFRALAGACATTPMGAATVHRATINRATVNPRQFTGRHLTGATINRSDN